jgi:hypothetical protein
VTTDWKTEGWRRDAAANLAEQIVKDLKFTEPPVSPFRVIRSERRIRAFGDDFGNAFDGRLEYQRPRFLLFYNSKYDAWPHVGDHHPRVNFTVAHELGHFFLTSHHDYLKHGGKPHGSRSEFVSDNNSEREADAFAAGLLLPTFLFKPRVNTTELTLDNLEVLAREFETSMLSTVIRAVRVSDFPAAAVGIRDGQIAWMFPSDPLIKVGCYPGKLALDSALARDRWKVFLAGDHERSSDDGLARHWFQMFGDRANELHDVLVSEEYLPVPVMNTLVVLLTMDEEDVYPEEEEEEEDEDDREHRARFGF